MSDGKKRKTDSDESVRAVRTHFVPCTEEEKQAVRTQVEPCSDDEPVEVRQERKRKMRLASNPVPSKQIKIMDDNWIAILEKGKHPVVAQELDQGHTNQCTRMALAYLILAAMKAMCGVEMNVVEIATTIHCAAPCKTKHNCFADLFETWKTQGKLDNFGFYNKTKTVWVKAPISFWRCLDGFKEAFIRMERLQRTKECIVLIKKGQHYHADDPTLRVDHAMVGVAVRCREDGERIIVCVNTYGSTRRFVQIDEEDMLVAFQVEIDVVEYQYFAEGKWTRVEDLSTAYLATWETKVDAHDFHRIHYRQKGWPPNSLSPER